MERMEGLPKTHPIMNRRSFLKLSGLLGLGVASAGIIPISAEAVRFNREMYKVSRTGRTMGTFVSMSIVHPSRDQAEEAMGKAFAEIDRLTALMNRFDETSAVGQLNKEGYMNDLPPEVHHVMAAALYHHRMTHGVFDISVKPLVDLFQKKFEREQKIPPKHEELKKMMELIGADSIELSERCVQFKKPGMGITLDGIAKGYIVDRASDLLERHQIENHLINAGGDIRTRGRRPDKKPWTVAIQDPFKRQNDPDIIHLTDGAISTSGDYEIYFDQQKMFHHMVNPRTGLGPELSISVSVMAQTTMEADALSTSVFVMEPEQGTRFINSLRHSESLVITKDGTQLKSKGWKSETI
jgi:FAD:protein FMN transferase